MIVPLLLVLLSVGVLVYAADVTVDAGSTLARRMGVSPLLIGLTLTSIGTSLPEVATNVAAGLSGTAGADASGMALGNVLGSNLALVTLFIGLAGIPAAMSVPADLVRRDGLVVVASLVLVGLLALDGSVGRGDAALLLLLYAAYLGVLLYQGKVPEPELEPEPGSVTEPPPSGGDAETETETETEAETETETEAEVDGSANPLRRIPDPLRLIGGLAMVLVSAHVMVQQGLVLAALWSVPEVIVGIAVGVATGFPELAVTLRAGRAAPELALGNLLGSSVANPLLALGSGALVFPVGVAWEVVAFDGVFTLLATVMALVLLWDRRELTRGESVVLLLLFVLYAWLRVTLVAG